MQQQRLTRNYKWYVICQRRRIPGSRVFLARLPLDPVRCRMWVKAIGQTDLVHVPIEKLHELKFVCDVHFTNEDFNDSRSRLLNHAAPTLLLPDKPLLDVMLQDFLFMLASAQFLLKDLMSITNDETVSDSDNLSQNVPVLSLPEHLVLAESDLCLFKDQPVVYVSGFLAQSKNK